MTKRTKAFLLGLVAFLALTMWVATPESQARNGVMELAPGGQSCGRQSKRQEVATSRHARLGA